MQHIEKTLTTVISNTEMMSGAHLLWIEDPDIARVAHPGQFVMVRCDDLLLRRPLSIHRVAGNQVAFLFNVVGKGSHWLSRLRRGDTVDVLGPLGRGFDINSTARNLLLLAGGIGIAPLIFLAERALPQHRVVLVHGVRMSRQLYLQPLPEKVEFVPVTEDGSMGRAGVISEVVSEFLDGADHLYACGPLEMYKAMTGMVVGEGGANKFKVEHCQVSLEVRMGCGIGACYGCSVPTRKGQKRVCADGPVFDLRDIIWEEIKI